MKRFFSLLTAPLLLAGLLFSCKPEQSELNLEALPGTATVTGKVEINPGITKVGDAYIDDYKEPAVGRTVSVKVYLDSYIASNDENPSESYRTFRATTDENGRYSVSVPVGYNAIEATVTVLPFLADKTIKDNNDNLITLENAVYNTVEDEKVTLEDQTIKEVDLLMKSNKKLDVVYDQKITLRGMVQNTGLLTSETGLRDTLLPYASNLTIRVSVSGENGSTQKYTIKSNAQGQYNLDVILPNDCWENTITVSVTKEAAIENFTHYYRKNGETNWLQQTVEVLCQGSVDDFTLDNERHKLIPVDMPTLKLEPDPVYRDQVKGIGNDSDTEENIEYNNPLNW